MSHFNYPPPGGQQPYYPPPGAGPPPQQYPPQRGYPPPQQGGYPPPQQQQYYPPHAGGGAPPPPQGYPGYPPQQQGYPPQQQGYYGGGPPPVPQHPSPGFSAPPPVPQHPSPGFSAPPPVPQHPSPGFSAPPPAPGGYPPHSPVPGYAPPPGHNHGHGHPQQHHIDTSADAQTIYKACKGFGTNEKALISVLGNRPGAHIDALRRSFPHGDLIKLLDKETSGNLNTALVSTAMGPLESNVFFAHRAIDGAGTNEAMLTEAVIGRGPAELAAMKQAFHARYRKNLDTGVRGDLSMKTEELFMMALSGRRVEEWVQPVPQQIQTEVGALYSATKRRIGTDETTVSRVLTAANDAQLRAIAYEYNKLHGDLVKMLKSEFSGHMKDVFVYLVEGAVDKPKRDAALLEASMKGIGTKDDLLIQRVVRVHWDPQHLANVKVAFKNLYKKDLAGRIKGETSGYYRDMLLELVR